MINDSNLAEIARASWCETCNLNQSPASFGFFQPQKSTLRLRSSKKTFIRIVVSRLAGTSIETDMTNVGETSKLLRATANSAKV